MVYTIYMSLLFYATRGYQHRHTLFCREYFGDVELKSFGERIWLGFWTKFNLIKYIFQWQIVV